MTDPFWILHNPPALCEVHQCTVELRAVLSPSWKSLDYWSSWCDQVVGVRQIRDPVSHHLLIRLIWNIWKYWLKIHSNIFLKFVSPFSINFWRLFCSAISDWFNYPEEKSIFAGKNARRLRTRSEMPIRNSCCSIVVIYCDWQIDDTTRWEKYFLFETSTICSIKQNATNIDRIVGYV